MSKTRWAVLGAITALGVACSTNVDIPSGAAASTGSGAGGSPGSGGGGSVSLTHPPPAGPAKPPDGAGSVTLAIRKLYLGDTDPDGTPDEKNGWKHYGFDLDGKASTEDSKDLCKPRDNAPPDRVYPDGDGGIDNSFGRNILPIFLGLESDFTAKTNASLAAGESTSLITIDALGAGADYNPLAARYDLGAPLGKAPLFDGADLWPIVPDLLADPKDPTSSIVTFPNSYLTANTWVGHASGDLQLSLYGFGVPLVLTISHAVIAIDLDSAHHAGTHGTIAGVLSAEALVLAIKKAAVLLDPSICQVYFESLTAQIEQASDILEDGTQDPNKQCTGISIGLGFDAGLVQLGPVADPVTPVDPCKP